MLFDLAQYASGSSTLSAATYNAVSALAKMIAPTLRRSR